MPKMGIKSILGCVRYLYERNLTDKLVLFVVASRNYRNPNTSRRGDVILRKTSVILPLNISMSLLGYYAQEVEEQDQEEDHGSQHLLS